MRIGIVSSHLGLCGLTEYAFSDGAHIDQNQFNWLNTIFYLFFLGFEYPQNVALQYLPVGKWMR